ncbi:MAG: DUF5060 domain-containing protein [Fimbriiglobus sp.]
MRSVFAFGWLAIFSVLSQAADGNGSVVVTGDMERWHTLTFTVDGPLAQESDTKPNPFTDYRLTVNVKHKSGRQSYSIPGYFAADGKAGDSSATSGTKWRAHFCPDQIGEWTYSIDFVQGEDVALSEAKGEPCLVVAFVFLQLEVQKDPLGLRMFEDGSPLVEFGAVVVELVAA